IGETREWTYVRKDNVRMPVLVTVNAIMAHGGEPRGYICIAHDLSAQRTAERRFAWANMAFRRAFDSAPVAIILTRNDMTCAHANPAFRALTGFSMDELRGRSMLDLIGDMTQHELDEVVARYQPLIDNKLHVLDSEIRMKRANGTEILTACHTSVVLE